jgi:hypothetical protein
VLFLSRKKEKPKRAFGGGRESRLPPQVDFDIADSITKSLSIPVETQTHEFLSLKEKSPNGLLEA